MKFSAIVVLKFSFRYGTHSQSNFIIVLWSSFPHWYTTSNKLWKERLTSDIQVIAWDMHKNVPGLNILKQLMGCLPPCDICWDAYPLVIFAGMPTPSWYLLGCLPPRDISNDNTDTDKKNNDKKPAQIHY
jgi:hypothetical protein